MPSIDQKIVQMMFDNKQFEEGVAQSTKSLETLKKGLDLDKSAQSLANLENTAKGFNISGIADGIDKIAEKFNWLGVVGASVLNKLTNEAVDAGMRFAKSVSVDQISAGMGKYETETRAVQTIMNATGKSIEEVEEVMEKLMTYTDETSYDFSTMVETIGKFTSVGVDLKTAEEAMEGIANEAAKSGAGVQEANHAMYNFAQALSTGSVKLQDWRSIANANMSTKEFKETLIETAKELGVLSKQTDVNYQTFESTLAKGWLTSDVLIKTLQKYSDTSKDFGRIAYEAAQKALTFTDAINATKDAVSSGWSKTFKLLFGNLEEAKVLWTNVANSLYEFVSIFFKARNELLEGWHDLGGYNSALEAASNIWHTFMNVVYMVKDAIEDVFPPITSERLVEITKKIEEASKRLRELFGWTEEKEVEKTMEKVTDHAQEMYMVMKRGDRSGWVSGLQTQLIKAGYALDRHGADGIFGPETEKAVKKLQKALGVDVTGAWDEATRNAAMKAGIFKEVEEYTDTVTEKTGRTSVVMKHLGDILEGILATVKLVKSAISTGLQIVAHFFSLFKPFISPLLDLLAIFGRMAFNLEVDFEVYDRFGKILDTVKKKLKPFGDAIKIAAVHFQGFLDRYKYWSRKYGKFTFADFLKFTYKEFSKTKFGKKVDEFVQKVTPLVEKIVEFFRTIKEAVVGFFTADVGGAKSFGEALQKRLEPFKQVWEWIKTNIVNLFNPQDVDGAGEAIDVFAVIGEKVQAVVEFLKGVNVAQLLLFGLAIIAAFKMYKRIRAPLDVVTNIAEIPKQLAKALKNRNASKLLENIGEFAKNLGIGVALLAASVFALAQLDVGKAWGAVGMVAALSALMVGVAFVMKKLKLDGINTKGFLKFSAMILILSNAVISLSKIPADQLTAGLIGLTVILGEVVAFSKLMKKDKIQVGSLIDLGTGIGMIAGAVEKLGKMKTGDMIRGLAGIGVILVELGVFLKMVNGKEFKNGPMAMIGLGAAMLMLTVSLKMISKMSWEDIGKGLVGLGAVLLELAAFMRLTSGFGSSKNFLGMVGIGVAVLLLAKSLEVIAKIDTKGIIKGIVGLGAIMAELAIFMAAVGGRNAAKQAGLALAMVGIGVAVSLFAMSLKSLGKMKTGAILKGIVGLGAVMLELAVFMKLIGGRNGLNMMGNAAALVGIGAALNLFVLAIAGLSMINGGGILKAVVALGAIMLEIGIFLKIADGISTSIKTIPVLIAMAGSLLIFSLALVMLADIPWPTIIAFGVSFGVAMSGLSSAMLFLSWIPIGNAMRAIANLDIFIANLMLVLAAIGGLEELTKGGLSRWLEKGAQALGKAIGGFIHGIISPFQKDGGGAGRDKSKSLTDYLNEFITEMSGVMDNLQPFLEKVKMIDKDSVTGMKNLSKVLLSMTGTELVDTIANWIVGDETGSAFVAFAKDMVELVPYLKEVGDAADGINTKGIKTVKSAVESFGALAEAVVPMAVAEIIDSIVRFVSYGLGGSGESPFISFAKNLVDLIPPVKDFGNKAKSINNSNIEKAADAMTAFAKVCNAAKDVAWDGFVTNIISFLNGDQDILSFADKMAELAPKLVDFGKNAKKVDNESISKAAGSLTALAEVAGKIPGAGGLIQQIFGEHDIEGFGTKLKTLGKGIFDFYTETKGIPSDYSADGFASSLSALAQVAKDIPGAGGFIQQIMGDKDLESFGQKLKPLGEGLADFAAATKDIPDDYAATGPVNVLTALSNLESGLTAHGGISQWFSGEKDLGAFAEKLAGVGTNLFTFSYTTESVNAGKMKEIGEALSVLADAVTSIPDSHIINDNIGGLQTLVDGLTENVDYSGVEQIGENVATYFSNGITAKSSDPVTEFDNLTKAAYEVVKWYYGSFEDAGDYLDRGLIVGLIRGSNAVTDTAERVALAAYNRAKNALDINSPSGKGEWLGRMFDAGLAGGLEHYSDAVGKNAHQVGENAVDNAKRGLEDFMDVITSDLDDDPVIRPVLDLSMVENGARDIDGLLRNDPRTSMRLFASLSTDKARDISARGIQDQVGMVRSSMDRNDSNFEKMFSDFSEKFSKLEEDMQNLKVVLSDGTLVGAILPKIDRGLGKRSAIDSRARGG